MKSLISIVTCNTESHTLKSLERPSMPRYMYHHTLSTVGSNNCKNSFGIYTSALTLSSPTMLPSNGAQAQEHAQPSVFGGTAWAAAEVAVQDQHS